MSEQSYDLREQSWIPVTWVAPTPDKPNKVGIRRALTDSQEIRSVSHTSPFVEFGLYRLLITIVLDAYILARQRPTIAKMKAMLGKAGFAHPVLSKYLDSHGGAFYLWGDTIPFLQHKRRNDGSRMPSPKPVVTMFPAIPSGTNVAHWHHYSEDELTISEEVAAQFLTTVSPFNFKVKPGEARTLAGDPPMYALVLGKDLFETIVLNLPRPNGRVTASEERNNGPVWRTPLKPGKLPKVPTIAQGFTWPVRIIALQKGEGVVAAAINEAAYKKPTEKAKGKGGNLYDARYGWRDPNAGTETTKDGIVHIKAKPGIPVWRDAVPLFLVASEGEALRGDKRRSRPEVITNALRVLDTSEFRVAVYGMRKKSGGGGDVKVEEWFRSVLTLPTEVARDSRLSARAIEAFGTTQKVANTLRDALRMLRPVNASKNKKAHRGEADTLSDFWQRLESVLARSYLDDLSSNMRVADEGLRATLRREAREAFTRASAPQRRSADGLFRIANARNWFERRLGRLLPKPQPENEL